MVFFISYKIKCLTSNIFFRIMILFEMQVKKMAKIGREIRILSKRIDRCVENLNTLRELKDCTGSNGWILLYLYDHASSHVSQKEIENSFGITRSTTSLVLSLMEKKSLIERYTDPLDSRSKKIFLTEKGKSMVVKIRRELSEFEQHLVLGFTEEELLTFHSFLERLNDNIKEVSHD